MQPETVQNPSRAPTSLTRSMTQSALSEAEPVVLLEEISFSYNLPWRRKPYMKLQWVPKLPRVTRSYKSPQLHVENTKNVIWAVREGFPINSSGITVQVLISRPVKLDLVIAEYKLSADAIFARFLENSNDQTTTISETIKPQSSILNIIIRKDGLSTMISSSMLSHEVIKQMKTGQAGVELLLGLDIPGDRKDVWHITLNI
ncbi:hypothetical protein BDN72DRAFT_84838 [Pluteus cervinus]|uniref:Uncharacterized protein n=1 Tax=Pluteus cervinus TaxID=181527 RepID=A0ACD3AQ73_9AGAR|nr:hypothetical protein BDN72DRAFT_84838 [Pluteus cervinus]